MKPSSFAPTMGRLVAGVLLALAVSLPAAPALTPAPGVTFTEAGRWPGWPRGWAQDVAMFGHHACVLTSGGLLVFDVGDAAAPRLVGSSETPGSDVVLQGHQAYFISLGALQIVDLGDPTRPKPTGRHLSEDPSAVAVSGQRAYVADAAEGLLIVDVGDPAHPVRVGVLPMSGDDPVSQVVVAGHHVYLAGTGPQRGVQVVDAGNPAQPVRRGRIPTPGRVSEMAVAGNLLLAATGDDISFVDHRLRILDLSDPANPRLVATHPTAEAVSDIFVAGPLAYVTDMAGLLILDLGDPANPRQVRRIAPQTAGRQGGPGLALKIIPTAAWRGVAMAGQRLCLAAGGEGLRVFDAGDPTEPLPAGRFETAGWASAVAVAGHHAYLADGDGGVRVLDLTDPARPALTGQVKLERPAGQIVVSGQRAYVNYYNRFAGAPPEASRLYVLDITNPAAPTQVGHHAPGRHISSLAVAGDHVGLTWSGVFQEGEEWRWKTGLGLLDVRDPANLRPLGQLELNGATAMLALDEGRAYVATADGLEIVDVGNPASPVRAGVYPVRGLVTSLALTSVSRPVSPELPGSTATFRTELYALVGGAGLFLEPGEPGVHLVNVTHPARPVRAALYPTGAGVMRMAQADGRLYVLTTHDTFSIGNSWSMNGELLVLDVRDPAQPVRLGGMLVGQEHRLHDLAVLGDHLVLADGERGLLSWRLGSAPRLLGIRALDDAVVLRFAAGGSDPARFGLESTASLAAPVVWTPVPVAGFLADPPDGLFEATTGRQGDARMYRVVENR